MSRKKGNDELTVDMTAEGGLVMMEMAGSRWSEMIVW